MRKLIVYLAFLAPAAAHAEIASNELDGAKTRLYYADGADAVQAGCAAGTHVFDHATCQDDVHRIPLAIFGAAVAREFGGELESADREAQDLWVRLRRVETRLDEVLVGGPAPAPTAPTRAEIEQSIAAVGKAEGSATAAADQVARLTAALAARPSDAALAQQLTISRDALRDLAGKLAAARDAHAALYMRFLAAARANDPTEFQDLVAQHGAVLADFKATKDKIAAALTDAALGQKLLARAAETFVWESSTAHPLASIARLVRAFGQGDHDYRTFHAVNAEGRGIVKLDVPRPGKVESIACYFPEDNGMICDGVYFTHAPHKIESFARWEKLTPQYALVFDTKKNQILIDGFSPEDFWFWKTVPAGTWTLEAACVIDFVDGEYVKAPGVPECTMTLQP